MARRSAAQARYRWASGSRAYLALGTLGPVTSWHQRSLPLDFVASVSVKLPASGTPVSRRT